MLKTTKFRRLLWIRPFHQHKPQAAVYNRRTIIITIITEMDHHQHWQRIASDDPQNHHSLHRYRPLPVMMSAYLPIQERWEKSFYTYHFMRLFFFRISRRLVKCFQFSFKNRNKNNVLMTYNWWCKTLLTRKNHLSFFYLVESCNL